MGPDRRLEEILANLASHIQTVLGRSSAAKADYEACLIRIKKLDDDLNEQKKRGIENDPKLRAIEEELRHEAAERQRLAKDTEPTKEELGAVASLSTAFLARWEREGAPADAEKLNGILDLLKPGTKTVEQEIPPAVQSTIMESALSFVRDRLLDNEIDWDEAERARRSEVAAYVFTHLAAIDKDLLTDAIIIGKYLATGDRAPVYRALRDTFAKESTHAWAVRTSEAVFWCQCLPPEKADAEDVIAHGKILQAAQGADAAVAFLGGVANGMQKRKRFVEAQTVRDAAMELRAEKKADDPTYWLTRDPKTRVVTLHRSSGGDSISIKNSTKGDPEPCGDLLWALVEKKSWKRSVNRQKIGEFLSANSIAKALRKLQVILGKELYSKLLPPPQSKGMLALKKEIEIR